MSDSFFTRLRKYSGDVEKYLLNYIRGKNEIPLILKEAMLYSILAGGKRLRPGLLLGTYAVFTKVDIAEAVPFASSVEMIHTYSLIHDDLPAMDNDDYRRGKPSNHKIFGEAEAILAGDALLNASMENILENLNGDGIDRKIRASAVIMEASGAMGMVGGQILDIRGFPDDGLLREMYDMKTGALLRASVLAGAILGGCSPGDETELAGFAENLGCAFQIKDDILDVEGESSIIGKPGGSDERNKKTTYITYYGVEETKKRLNDHIEKALLHLGQINGDTGFLVSLAEYIRDREE